MKKATAKFYWAVYVGQRWNDRVFVFEDAERASIFAETAVTCYCKEISDYSDDYLQVSISVISEKEYNEKISKYNAEHEAKSE